MWGLDRLSAHPTPRASPPPRSREFSPAPRKSLNLLNRSISSRPDLQPRTSSLLSNPSLAPAPPTISGVSGFKSLFDAGVAADIQDPVSALAQILQSEHDLGLGTVSSVADSLGSAKSGDLSLEEIAREGLAAPQCLDDAGGSAAEFENEHTKFEDIHASISNNDHVLRSVEEYLSSFHADLGVVATEIETLQTRSTALNAKLESRRRTEKAMAPIVARLVLQPDIVKRIAEGPIDEQFLVALDELSLKAQTVESNESQTSRSRAVQDMQPVLDALSKKAIERIRDYFASRIKAIRAPNVNAQHIQANEWLKQRRAFAFLAQHHLQLAEEMLQAYSNTMRWYYASHFTHYHASLSKLKLSAMSRTDLLAESLSGKAQTANSNKSAGHDPFNIGRRAEILRDQSTNALAASTAVETKTTSFLETPFWSFNVALLDNATFEYSFLTAFLPSQSPLASPRAISEQLRGIFAACIDMGNSLVKQLTTESYDALGLLLALRLNQKLAFVAQKRKIPTLDSYINGINLTLWPRFQIVLDAHCESLKKLTASLPSRSANAGGSAAGAALASLGGGASTTISTAPSPVTQRFASLLQGILVLSDNAGDDEPVSNSLARLRSEFDAFLNKMAITFGAGERGRKERERFLANNYSLVITIVADAKGRLADECKQHFEGIRRMSK